jgi:hypothetical protein
MAQLSNMIRQDGAAIVLVLLTAASSHGHVAPRPKVRKNCLGELISVEKGHFLGPQLRQDRNAR